VSGQTTDSVSFSITNTDIAPVTISWIIRLNNPDNGSPAASNTVSNVQPGATITAQATGLGSGLTF
jgi:hypothetical protein